MQCIDQRHPLRRLFMGLVEDAFCTQVGMCDPTLTDYLADLLVNFTHVDRLHMIREAAGKRLDEVATMLIALSDERPQNTLDRDRKVYRHIGDCTLFWAGVYPEHLKRLSRSPSDVLLDYVSQGKRSYAIVSELADDDNPPPRSLFRHLSDDFESCVFGLGLVRKGWEQQTQPSPPGDLLY